MKYFITAVFVFLLSSQSVANEWSGPYEYSKFDKGYVAGTTQKGLPIYLGMALHDENAIDLIKLIPKTNAVHLKEPKTIPNNSHWVIGKVRKIYNGLRFGHHLEENYSKSFLMFTPSNESDYTWKKGKDGSVPSGSVKVWGDAGRYVCRGEWAEAVIPGTLTASEQVCKIAFGGRVFKLFVYEVLTKKAK